MKILKYIGIAILVIIAIPFIVALGLKKEYQVQREVVIDKPKNEVFDYVKFLKNQERFSKWASMDPLMKKTYRGTDGTIGFVSSWDSEKEEVGAGEQEIKSIVVNERIDYELRFFKPFVTTATAFLSFEEIDENHTKVVWGLNDRMKYPMNLMLLFMDIEKMIGDDLKVGLDNLKTVLEKNQPE